MHKKLLNQCVLVIGIFVIPSLVTAKQIMNFEMPVQYRVPDFPVAGNVMNNYFLTGQYVAHLSVTELQIDHMANQTECSMPNRRCRFSLGYSTPIGHLLGQGQFELPLFSAEGVTSQWERASVGDYVARFWSAPSNVPQLPAFPEILLSLKF